MRANQILLIAVLAFTVLLGAGAYTMQQLRLLQQYTEEVNASQNILLELEVMLSQTKDVETGVRGYMLTSDTIFLEPYFRGKAYLDKYLPGLAEKRNQLNWPGAAASLDSFCVNVKNQVEIATQTVERTEIDSLNSGDRRRLMLKGKVLMDGARLYLDEIKTRQQLTLSDDTMLLAQQVRDAPAYAAVFAGIALTILAFLFYLLFEQVRELRRYRDSLKARFVELSTAYDNLGRYNTLTNHHLKEPLRKMLLFIDRYRYKHAADMRPAETELLTKIDELSRHTHLLLEDLSAISEFDTLGALEKQPVDLNQIVQEVLQKIAPKVKTAGAQITVNPALPTINAHPQGLRQLLQHLLENAVKFNRSGVAPRISVDAKIVPADHWRSEGRLQKGILNVCRISITDNGRGLALEHQDKVFQLFYQISGEEKSTGTGLGLALCQKIALLHNGFIHLQSLENKGSTFTIVLPV